jgi:hypothetical protein
MGAPQKETRVTQRARRGITAKGTSTSVYLLPGDEEQLKIIQDELGSSMSDAIRTSIRVYAAIITQMKRTRPPRN